MSGTAKPSYRLDIDGLRALAVLPVLLYHAGVPGFGGGYIGVDIFLVISGFLITGIIAREVDGGKFSILHFYERRARRILPALFAVVAFVLAAATWLYLPGDFEGVPRSALAALGFMANVWFFLQSGYFQTASEAMPLLHTWSLGVEEQFYIGFPVLLILVAKFAPRLRLAAVFALAAASFALAVLTQASHDGSAFYLLPARAWELLAGSLLALGAVPQIRSMLAREIVGLTGLAAIVAAAVLYDEHTIFPGIAALPPVLGAAALIHCAPGTMVGRLLSLRLPVAIGLISYSLYLWHWPLIVFTIYAQGHPLTLAQSAIIIAVSLAVAWLSWRFIEGPFRDPRRFGQKRIFQFSLGGIAALSAAALAMAAMGGWPTRFSDQAVRFAAAKGDVSPARDACLTGQVDGPRPQCNLGAKTQPSAMIWGDSHGVEMAWALGEVYAAKGQSIAQRTFASCPPAVGYKAQSDPACMRFDRATMAEAEASASIKTVYLAGFWAGATYREAGLGPQLDAAIRRLHKAGKHVVLIGPVPRQTVEVPRHLAMFGENGETASRAAYATETQWLRRYFPEWRAAGVEIIDPARVMVRGTKTVIVADGQPLYFDSHHLSVAGARKVLAAHPDL